jgi:CDGSH-type Zn-finger protein
VTSHQKKITISKNGPYLVTGEIPLAIQTIGANEKGDSTEWKQGKKFPATGQYALCRCGGSRNKPFCDGTHAKIGFDGTETASHETVMEQAEVLDGPVMQLADAEELCAFARFCDPNGKVWNQVEHTDSPEMRKHFTKQVGMCPSGRLIAIDKENGSAIEPELAQSIGVVEDPAEECSGPLWIRGGIHIIGSDGYAYEVRNRVTLCRCGRSQNKPFCNGAHAGDPKFRDGLDI